MKKAVEIFCYTYSESGTNALTNLCRHRLQHSFAATTQIFF